MNNLTKREIHQSLVFFQQGTSEEIAGEKLNQLKIYGLIIREALISNGIKRNYYFDGKGWDCEVVDGSFDSIRIVYLRYHSVELGYWLKVSSGDYFELSQRETECQIDGNLMQLGW